MYYISRMKDKKSFAHLNWCRKGIQCKRGIQYPFMLRTLNTLGIERIYLYILKVIYNKTSAIM
jgi:hypothetical protein